MRIRTCEKTIKALSGGNFEAALEEFSRESSCGSSAVFCPYKTEDITECGRDCLLGYLNYLSLTTHDEQFNKIVVSYAAWSKA